MRIVLNGRKTQVQFAGFVFNEQFIKMKPKRLNELKKHYPNAFPALKKFGLCCFKQAFKIPFQAVGINKDIASAAKFAIYTAV